jgi:predicted amidohydrolase YtcJ
MAARMTAYLVALIVGTTLIAGLIVGAQRDDAGPVDLIVTNGRVYTADGQETMAEAVAVQGNKILRVGTAREIQRLRRAQTRVIDAKGGAVLPGFNDAHLHLLSGGLALSNIDLQDARTLPAIEATIREWTREHADRPWVTGRGWYYDAFPGGMPTRQLLDSIVSDRPAYLISYDGHTGWANSAALKLAAISRRTPNPVNGTIVKDARTGEPTGVLKEAAMSLVTAIIPKPSDEQRRAALQAAIATAHRHGITSAQIAGGAVEDVQLIAELHRKRALDLRVYAALSADVDTSPARLDEFDRLRTSYLDDPVFKVGAVKLVLDGVIESQTAALLEPYATRSGIRGEPRIAQETLDQLVGDLDAREWQIMIHAIGDRAIRMALDAYQRTAAARAPPQQGRRHRIEHIETIDPSDVPRFGQLGVIASMQPYHSVPDLGGVWSVALGEERASRAWLYGSIAKAGGRLAFGSDWPVMTLDPLLGLHVAVNRTTLEGEPEGGWLPAERLSLRQAVDAYTRDAAWASFDEHRKGSLERDMLADLVILTKDIFGLPPARLTEAEVAITIFNGQVVYQRPTETNE